MFTAVVAAHQTHPQLVHKALLSRLRPQTAALDQHQALPYCSERVAPRGAFGAAAAG